MTQARVRHSDIEVGKLLPWDIFDEKGNLLMRQGYAVNTDKQVEKLVAIGVYADAEQLRKSRLQQYEKEEKGAAPAGLLQQWLDLRVRMERLYDELDSSVSSGGHLNQIRDIAMQVDTLCGSRPDLAQAIISLCQEGRYSTRHMLDCAAVVRLAARALKMSPPRVQSLIHAALTMNLGTTTFQDDIKTQTEPLSGAQFTRLQQHPQEAVARLGTLGVSDPVWLRAVMEHHEQFDGQGYPHGLAGAASSADGQVLRLADIYCARITYREYRSAVPLTVALRDILREGGKSVEGILAGQFIRAVGIFPPGLQLKLLNGEKGVVARAGATPNHPIVISLLDSGGQPLVPGLLRDTQDPGFGVHETIDPTTFNAYIDIASIWG